ncbi:MAG: carboxypeptidase-like regulatory domain-containing protein [Anaerolineaceae bacterium]|nr:carboxypeptidase-like regulatory domain-containing protein [Anaerolineaceae bacterium]
MNHGKKIYFKLFFTLLLLVAVSSAFTQNLEKRITIEAHKQPLGEVIRQIGEKGDILFSYNPRSIPVDKIITVVARNTPLSKIFEKTFTSNGIDFTLTEKQVVLKLHKDEISDSSEPQLQTLRKYTISGFVRDKSTGESIIGANVYDAGSLQGTNTNAYGFYSLSLPWGNCRIISSFIGYSPVSQEVNLIREIEAIIELEVAAVDMKLVEIVADPAEAVSYVNQSGDILEFPMTERMMGIRGFG